MKVIYNSQLIDFEDIMLSKENRGFRYGDGLFETIAYVNGTPRLLNRHLARLNKGMDVLRLKHNSMLSFKSIRKLFDLLQKENRVGLHARIRLYVWREGTGLYCPINGKTNVLATIEDDHSSFVSFSENVGFSENAINSPSITSSFKTISALNYVIAGIEKSEKQLDDIIICDHNGNISETLSSNIFIKHHNKYFTPPLSTGCIDGIMKNWIMEALKKNDISIEEKLFSRKEILDSESIFTSNSMGISHIKNIGDSSFAIDQEIELLLPDVR